MGRYRPWIFALLVLALLCQMAVGMVTAARQQSPIVDEPVYVSASLVYLQQHSLEYNFEHPPLAKLIMATGLSFADARVDAAFEGTQWQLGTDVLYGQGNDAQRLLLLARLPLIFLALMFGLVVFAFARDLAGTGAGVVALGLYAFSPDVIAHGSLATLDLPTTGFLVTTLWLLWRARNRPYRYLPLAGLALGAALATKMSTLPALPLMAILVVVSVWHAGRAHQLGARLDGGHVARLVAVGVGAAAGVMVLSLVVVWATYLAVDPHLRWTSPADLPVINGLTGHLVDWLPMPRPFRDGMRVQLSFEGMEFPGYLLGREYTGSKWYYLPVALLIKEPLGMLALWLAGGAVMASVRPLRSAVPYVLLPTAVLLLVAMSGSRDFGVRYAIFVPVFLAVAAGCVVAYRARWAQVATIVLVGWVAVSSLRTFPYYLPYSNEAFGGPSQTYLRLSDANVDWGQDLARLGDRLAEKYPGERVWLLYRGRGAPAYYGIKAGHPLKAPASEVHGLVVVSTACLHSSICIPANTDPAAGRRRLAEILDSSERIDDVGHAILIYRR
ncbi:glycosyl transferase [Amorphoplanes nipponensis]|uniref:Glycosyl transferase n=1 Tax=Actinoplanes nipponensis TaxID=135950 RepID=A0A919JDS8_9ACTN|nr:glycosyltransferase family 39 protein [Actinoplanes nipponensis]GIE47097.1 glycosyl transferase [Actinoplanes nipponensis]